MQGAHSKFFWCAAEVPLTSLEVNKWLSLLHCGFGLVGTQQTAWSEERLDSLELS